MPREKVWTKAKFDAEIAPLLEKGWSVADISRAKGLSRQRLYKIISDLKDTEHETIIEDMKVDTDRL